jgi:putative transport protein
MDLFSNSYFSLFLIISLGFLLGKIKIKGISLDASAVIFIALIFGHYGILIPIEFQSMGLVLFIFTIAIQAGPGFVQSFRKKGLSLLSMAIVLMASALLITLLLSKLFNIDPVIGIGLLTGALTSTPGLAVAIDSTHSPLASIGYGIAYPFGVLGVILFVRLFPKFSRINLREEEARIKNELLDEYPEIIHKQFIVENKNILGKSIKELQIRTMTGASISRVLQKETAFTPSPDTVLYEGNLVRAVGTTGALEKVRLLIGTETKKEIPLGKKFVIQSILVTNKKIVNKTVSQLNLLSSYGATLTRIRRSGINIMPSPETQINFGDKLMIACDKDHIKDVVHLCGNEDKRLSDTDFFPIATGIVLGVLVGKIRIVFSDSFVFTPGLTGGVLIMGLVLSNLGKTGPIIWTMSGTANQLLRQLGLLLFLSTVGTHAGAHLSETFQQYGMKLFLVGGVITFVPMIFSALAARFFFKLDIFTFLGGLTGGMTSTPGLAAIDSMTDTNTAHLAYATVYPVALILVIICVQILSYLA